MKSNTIKAWGYIIALLSLFLGIVYSATEENIVFFIASTIISTICLISFLIAAGIVQNLENLNVTNAKMLETLNKINEEIAKSHTVNSKTLLCLSEISKNLDKKCESNVPEIKEQVNTVKNTDSKSEIDYNPVLNFLSK